MRSLASRSLLRGHAADAARIAAISVPMLFVECHNGSINAQKAPVVVVIPPAIQGPQAAVSAKVEKGGFSEDCPYNEACTTHIGTSFSHGVLSARLSIIKPDGKLEKVLLDPAVTFEVFRFGESPGSKKVLTGCWDDFRSPHSCDILALHDLPGEWVAPESCMDTSACDISGFLTGQVPVKFRVVFKPQPDSNLVKSASQEILTRADMPGEEMH